MFKTKLIIYVVNPTLKTSENVTLYTDEPGAKYNIEGGTFINTAEPLRARYSSVVYGSFFSHAYYYSAGRYIFYYCVFSFYVNDFIGVVNLMLIPLPGFNMTNWAVDLSFDGGQTYTNQIYISGTTLTYNAFYFIFSHIFHSTN